MAGARRVQQWLLATRSHLKPYVICSGSSTVLDRSASQDSQRPPRDSRTVLIRRRGKPPQTWGAGYIIAKYMCL